jgi:hypothetical protein
MPQLTSNYSSTLGSYKDQGSGTVSVGGGAMGAANGAMTGALAGGIMTGSLATAAAGTSLMSAGAVLGPVGMIVGGLLGGLFGSKKTKAPAAPTYEQIMSRNLTAQKNIQGDLLNLEGEYRPYYQGLQESTLNSQLYGGLGNQGYASMLEEANAVQQGIQGRSGAGYLNTLGGLSNLARYTAINPTMALMQDEMNRQAIQGLSEGTSLGYDEMRQANQAANSQMAMRGLTGRQGVAAGVLSNYGLGQQRQDRNRQFANIALANESKLQEASLGLANTAMSSAGLGGKFLAEGNAMLGQYQPQIFNPESNAGIQAQGMKYQEGMSLAAMRMQQQNQLLSTMGQIGMIGLQGGFKNLFGATPVAGTTMASDTLMGGASLAPQYGGDLFGANSYVQKMNNSLYGF